jgi:hypothetical protein
MEELQLIVANGKGRPVIMNNAPPLKTLAKFSKFAMVQWLQPTCAKTRSHPTPLTATK